MPGVLALLVVATACGGGADRPDRGDAGFTPTATSEAGLRSFRYDLAATASGVFGGAEGAEQAVLDIRVAGEVASI